MLVNIVVCATRSRHGQFVYIQKGTCLICYSSWNTYSKIMVTRWMRILFECVWCHTAIVSLSVLIVQRVVYVSTTYCLYWWRTHCRHSTVNSMITNGRSFCYTSYQCQFPHVIQVLNCDLIFKTAGTYSKRNCGRSWVTFSSNSHHLTWARRKRKWKWKLETELETGNGRQTWKWSPMLFACQHWSRHRPDQAMYVLSWHLGDLTLSERLFSCISPGTLITSK